MRSRRDLRFCSAIWAFKRHGRLDLVRCTACSATIRRAAFQDELAASMRQPGSNWTPRPHPVAMQTSNISTFLVSLVEGRLPRGIGVERLRDAPSEWGRQFEVLGLNPG